MQTNGRALRSVCVGLALVAATACSGERAPQAVAPVIPPAQPSTPPTGPGTYVGEAVNDIGTPVQVRVVIGSDLTAPPGPDANAASAYLRRAASLLDLPVPVVRFVTIEVDNTRQVDVVDLPANVDVLDADGRGANFRPAYDVLQETLDLLAADSPASEQGRTLVQRLRVREGEVRPGKIEVVPYISIDELTDVAQVVLNGSIARRLPAA